MRAQSDTNGKISRVFGSLVTRRFTGALRLTHQGRPYAVYWRGGAIVDAESSATEDTVGRVALDAGMIDGSTLSESIRRLAGEPGRSQKDILVDMGALRGEAVERVAGLVLTRRALRVFALPSATLVVEDGEHGRTGGPLEAHWLLYRGLRHHVTDLARLEGELADLGGQAVKLSGDAATLTSLFGFSDEAVVVTYAQRGYWELADLVDACVTSPQPVARPVVLATIAALHAVGALDVQPAAAVPRLRRRQRDATPRLGKGTQDLTPAHRDAPLAPMVATGSAPIVAAGRPPAPTRAATWPQGTASGQAVPPSSGVTAGIRDHIQAKLAQVEGDADHFAILEIDRAASPAQIKGAYLKLAKIYHPDRLAHFRLEMLRPQVERILACLNDAYAALSDDARHAQYERMLDAGGARALERRADEVAVLTARVLTAEDHFRKGEMALRRQMWSRAIEDFRAAVDLNQDEPQHHAYLAWARWSASTEKSAVYPEVKKGLMRALEIDRQCVPALYYLGQVYAARGDVEHAYALYRRVIDVNEAHVDALREVRLIEMRRDRGRRGLFDRFTKRK
jgi:curved DNA-binding protein CbpA